jgi:hypothetical protein
LFSYTGQPGVLTVVAELSTDNGWSTTVPLAGERPVGPRHDGTVRLDWSLSRSEPPQRPRSSASRPAAVGQGDP